ncbi:hypothetical protein [Sulfoacidibacillus thermotolerans]|uniref:Uncharacterized protein n=1 Tax=Sulfoacidibacillus thermotolerans TaxID=1765684 RepID=A0A2U3D5X8_SULT2|nr:hypothetical protein [Sulfoacidibacillus thermotolerans]PWI56676.1 hypothetical protein BM613_12405 [Sulfoacidibacillus thermotolerans]
MIRRSERPNPLLKHVEEYRKSSKPQLKLERDEIEHLARVQTEAFVNHPDIRSKLKEVIGVSDPHND